jgi:tryptophan-rich sensory protein
MDWYATLTKPSYTPPGWFIGSMWTAIYILSGIAAWRVWSGTQHDDKFRMIAVVAGLNVLLNGSWSFIFFGLHMMLTAVVVAGVLAVTVWILIGLIWGRDKIAAALLIPYGLWTPFATYLAWSIYRLNLE